MSIVSESHPLFDQWNGLVVPRSFHPGFVTLSYVVSLLGAASTLELINRRTAPKGKFNHLLLVSAAVTMGGIAIWCMHYIGNRAVTLADGEEELQIAYSAGFTAISFFVPILVLLAAFVAIGTSSEVSWWRVATGGTLAGAAICGMHYLGNASISNYVCVYNFINVGFSALIAVVASITALALFFVFRASWKTITWWKRGGTAILLAGAVSGMHWCASTGTQYRLVALNQGANETSRTTTVIIVICLSLGACFIIGGTVIYTARVMSRYADKAQQVVLATAIFDKQGRVLVSPEGLLPSEKITDSFLEKDTFGVAHPLFQWMFQASRNWSNISSIVDLMIDHLGSIPLLGRDTSRNGIKLVDEHGELIENYDIIFKELFCAAARALAEKTKSSLSQVGILWDEILPTGTSGDNRQQQHARGNQSSNGSDDGLAEKGEASPRSQQLYRGSLMFLVRRVDSARETTDLEAAGYRFADLHQVSGIISSTMQIKTTNVETKLANMAKYAQEETSRLAAGVHLGFFAVRATVGSQGFDVLVRRNARHLLPSVQMPIDQLNQWQLKFLRQLDGLTPAAVTKTLKNRKQLSAQDFFASQILTSLDSLRNEIEDDIFEAATLTAKVVQVACRPGTASGSPTSTASLIAFKVLIPSHHHVRCPGLEFVPLSLFKIHQLVHKDSPHNLIFSRSVHREIPAILNSMPLTVRSATGHTTPPQQGALSLAPSPRRLLRSRLFGRKAATSLPRAIDADGKPVPTVFGRRKSNHSSSTLNLWNPAHNVAGGRVAERRNSCPDAEGDDDTTPKPSSTYESSENYASPGSVTPGLPRGSSTPTGFQPKQYAQATSFGGIMISQEVTVNVHEVRDGSAGEFGEKITRVGSGDSTRPLTAGRGAERPAKSTISIEMQPWGNKSGVTVQSESVSETTTFVDELFAACLDSR